MKAEAVIFDYGNTLLLDPFGKVLDLKAYDFLKVMERNGYEVSGKRLTDSWGRVNRDVNYPFCSHFSQESPLIEKALERMGVKEKDRRRIAGQLLAVYRTGLKQVIKKDERLEEVRRVLGILRDRRKRLYMLSNERADSLSMQVSWAGLAGFFEKAVASETVGIEKPDPRIFRHMLNVAGLPEGKVVYVGDDPERDIKAPKSLGMGAILLRLPEGMSVKAWRDYGFRLKEKEKPDSVIRDFREILDLIE